MMGSRLLRSRLLDRSRLAKILLVIVIVTLISLGGRKHRSAFSSHAHAILNHSSAHDIAEAISLGGHLTAADVSQPQYARALCREHGLDVFHKSLIPRPGSGSTKRKVFDFVTVDDELDWLEIRLNSTYDFVDYFVIVEGRRPVRGLDRPLTLKANWDRFLPYHDKIIYRELEDAADVNFQRPRDLESHQRNAPLAQVFPSLTGHQSPTQGDVLLVADVDELVRPEALLVLRACETPRRLTLHSRLYYHSFQFLHRRTYWPHPQATTYQGPKNTILPDDLRKGDGAREWGYFAPMARWPDKGDLWNAGWHCSSCFATVSEVDRTTEGDQMPLKAPEPWERNRFEEQLRRGEDLSDSDRDSFKRIERNEDVPSAVRINTQRWRNLLDRNGTSIGVEDHS